MANQLAAADRNVRYDPNWEAPSPQKWVTPAMKRLLSNLAQGVAASELTLLLSRGTPQLVSFAQQLAPALFRRLPALRRLAARAPATGAILVVNAFVYTVWQAVLGTREDGLIATMRNNFIMPNDPREQERRPHTALTGGFSHMDRNHLLSNMVALLTFGHQPETWLGARKFVYMYISSIYASKILNAGAFQRLLRGGGGGGPGVGGSLGASGAISALQAYFCLRFPTTRFRVGDRVVPAPWACVLWYLAELLQLGRERETGIGHGAHLGGYTFGAIFFGLNDVLFAPTKRMRNEAVRRILDVAKG